MVVDQSVVKIAEIDFKKGAIYSKKVPIKQLLSHF